jgi:hypothetical protein
LAKCLALNILLTKESIKHHTNHEKALDKLQFYFKKKNALQTVEVMRNKQNEETFMDA